MPFEKGRHKSGGRRCGTPNKLTGTFREALRVVYQGLGGHRAFLEWAQENQTEFYRLMARVIPIETEEINREPLTITIAHYTESVPITQLEDKRSSVQAEEMFGQLSDSGSS